MSEIYKLKIILLGANDRGALALAKEFKRRDFHVIVADWQDMSVKYSCNIDQYIILPNIEESASQFVQELILTIKENKVKYIFPINDAGLEVCDKFLKELSEISTIVGYTNSQYLYSHNKNALLEIAKYIGVKTPKSILIKSINQFNEILETEKLDFPLVCKPINSKLIKDDRLYSFNVKIVNNSKELTNFIRENINNVNIMLQEYIEGKGIGFNFFSINGLIKKNYAHERITEPLNGGQSSYRKTIPIDTYNIQDTSLKIIEKIEWNGIGMLEYKLHKGELYLMELNGRIWGSVMLGNYAGINIPSSFIDYYFFAKKISANSNYKIRYVRNLKLDLKYLIEKYKKERNVFELFKWLLSLTRSFLPIEKIEDNPIKNIRVEIPSWIDYVKRFLFNKSLQKKISKKDIKRKPIIKNNQKIAFVCTGNICRSPFAELYAKKHFNNFVFNSFGLIFQANRLSSVNAEIAAKEFDINICTHQSRILTKEEIENQDIIFIMDKYHYYTLSNKFPEYLSKIFFLDNKEIIDPYGNDSEFYKKTYSQIASAINNIISK